MICNNPQIVFTKQLKKNYLTVIQNLKSIVKDKYIKLTFDAKTGKHRVVKLVTSDKNIRGFKSVWLIQISIGEEKESFTKAIDDKHF